MEREDHEKLGDELEQEADRLEEKTDRLGGEVDDVRADWRAKQRDPGVPGAVGGDEDEGGADREAEPREQSGEPEVEDERS